MAKVGAKRAVGVSRDAMRRARDRQEVGSTEIKTNSVAPSEKHPITIRKAAARLRGGPKDSFVYYVDDLEHEQRIAERMGTKFPYYPTKAHTTLPWTGGVQGVIWQYRP